MFKILKVYTIRLQTFKYICGGEHAQFTTVPFKHCFINNMGDNVVFYIESV